MNIIDIFLSELQNRISATASPINDFENKRNELMEIDNILYAHNIVKNEIDLNDLFSFTNEEVRRILAIIDEAKADSLYRTYQVYKPLVLMYNNLKDKFGEDFDAPQYLDAIKWLNELVKRTNKYLVNFEMRNKEYINSLKQDSLIYKKYYDMFNGGNLISPIIDLDEFNELVDKMNFTDEEKGKLKKKVGIDNIRLLRSNQDVEKEEVKEEVADLTVEETNKIQEEITPNLENATEKDAESNIKEDIDINKENDTNEDVLFAKKILEDETDLINSVSDEEFNDYLAQSLNDNDNNQVKYQMVSILIALHSEIDKYYNFKDVESARNMALDNIKEYIEVYKILKQKL